MRILCIISTVMALTTTACSNSVVIQDDPGPRGSYFKGDLSNAVRNGAIVTVVVGNPFGMEKARFDDRVRGLMKHENRELPAEFVAAHSDRTVRPYRVVVAFDLRKGISVYDACTEPGSLATVPRSRWVNISVAFCQGDSVKSATEGYVGDVSSVDDPKFSELVKAATRYMVSDYDYENDNTGPRVP